MSKHTALTADDIQRGYDNNEWLGWGYLGGREHLSEDDRNRADMIVVAYANNHRWDANRLFVWLNSRPGRWFADDPFGRHATACLGADLTD